MRHIDIRYFHIKDLVDKDLVQIKYFLTEKILVDFFVKLL